MPLRFTIVLVLLFVCLAVPRWADGQVGVDAYKRGDYATALREWRPLAEQGDAGAQFYLGTLYAFGRGVSQNYAAARQRYGRAAGQCACIHVVRPRSGTLDWCESEARSRQAR